jgi:NitT/TauT family transport system ATP-binding protein
VEPAFHAIHKAIWATLRVEVQKAYAQGEQIPGEAAQP